MKTNTWLLCLMLLVPTMIVGCPASDDDDDAVGDDDDATGDDDSGDDNGR